MKAKKKHIDLFVRITTVYICLMLTVFLFFCGSSGYQEITAAKFRIVCILCGGYAAVMALAAVESLIVGTVKLRSPVVMWKAANWGQRLVVAYVALTWVSALLSDYFPDTLIGVSRYEGALTITLYGVCFLLVSVFGRTGKWQLWLLGVVTTLFSVLCLVQMAGFNPFGLYPDGLGYGDAYIKYAGAYLGTIGNVDLVAALLCLVIPVIWVALLRLKGKMRFLLFVPLLLSLVVLLKMNVQAGLVGVIAGGIVMLPVVAPVSAKCKKILWGIIAALIVAGVAVLFAFDMGSGFWHELHELLHGRVSDSFGSGRIRIWKQVLQVIPEHLWFGTGPDTMLYAGLEAFSRYDASIGATIVAEIDIAHNEYLNVLFHQGVFAFLAYVGTLVVLAKKWLTESANDPVTAILGGAVWCYCVQAFFGFSMCITAPLFWLALGLLAGRKTVSMTGGRKK